MTEKEFLKVFNDIEDKYVEEDSGENAPIKPVIVTKNDVKGKRSPWNKTAAAAACIAAAGGLIVVSVFFGGGFGDHNYLDPFLFNGYNDGDTLFWDGSYDDSEYYTGVVNSNPSFVNSHPFFTVNPGLDPENTVDPSYELPLLDGTHIFCDNALISDIQNYNNEFYSYALKGCYAVPFFTPSERRTAGEDGDWFFLTEGSEIDGLTVKNAFSIYDVFLENGHYFPCNYQAAVEFSGVFECTAKAELCENEYGDIKALLTLERESCEKLFSLCPNIKVYDKEYADSYKFDFNDEKICFDLFNKLQGFEEIYDAFSKNESVRVKLKLKDFHLIYLFEPGNNFSGVTQIGGLDYELEVLE